jgi:hypothetical protein
VRERASFRFAFAMAITSIAAVLAACESRGVAAADPDGRLRLSFFALGDTGTPPGAMLRSLETQMRVADALSAEHRRRPVDALVLLGDNFYPDGLNERDLVERVRENVVRPYCSFLAVDGPSWPAVADACPLDRQGDRPVPLYAVLGNHDFTLPESPRLQREVVPRFVPNWRVPPEPVEVVELLDADLVPSASLILYDPLTLADRGDGASLERAVREARGPWRILAGHYPVNGRHPGPWIRQVLEGIDVPVHLHLSGHEHNLQIGTSDATDPYLHAVAGSGSSMRAVRDPVPGSRFERVAPGFARVDLAGDGAAARLVVSLVALPVSNLAFWREPAAVARWSVGLEGDTREELLVVSRPVGR